MIACLNDKAAARKILEHLGLPSTGPPISRARTSTWTEASCWQGDVPEAQLTLP